MTKEEDKKAENELLLKSERVSLFPARLALHIMSEFHIRLRDDIPGEAEKFLDIVDAFLTDAWYGICKATNFPPEINQDKQV